MIYWQAFLWDKFAKFFPLIFFAGCIVSYSLGYRNIDYYLNVGLAFLAIMLVAWWFWVLYTITLITVLLESNEKDLRDVIKEIKELYKEIKN